MTHRLATIHDVTDDRRQRRRRTQQARRSVRSAKNGDESVKIGSDLRAIKFHTCANDAEQCYVQ